MGQRKMNGATTTVFERPGNVLPMRGNPDDPTVRPPTWMERRGIELGVIEMAATPTKPPGLYVNFSTATFLILVISAIAGLWWFTWQTAETNGYERGKQEVERRQLEERIQKAEENERRRVLLEASRSGQQTGHEQETKK